MDKRPQIYDPRIMKYARDKTHYGGVENPSFSSQRSNVACGDSLAIAGIIKEGKIVEIKFTGSGFGHGTGLCQWGAKGMAERGYKYQAILKFYYKNVRISKIK